MSSFDKESVAVVDINVLSRNEPFVIKLVNRICRGCGVFIDLKCVCALKERRNYCPETRVQPVDLQYPSLEVRIRNTFVIYKISMQKVRKI
jgi:hypothetical protein